MGLLAEAAPGSLVEAPWSRRGDLNPGPAQFVAEGLVDGAGELIAFPGSEIEGLRWWGASGDFTGEDPVDCAADALFDLTFRADDGAGLPGAVVSSTTVNPTITDTGLSFLGLAVWQYDAPFASGLDGVG